MNIIRNSDNGWIEGREEMKYRKKILMDNVPPSVNLIEDIIINAGGKIPKHAHKKTAEIFYIIKGKTKLITDKKETELSCGDILFIDVGESHSFINNSNETLRMLVIKINFEHDDAILYPRGERMKIAISSEGESEDSEVSPISGRAPYYLIFEDGKLVKTIKNPFKIGGGGAGFSVAQMLADEKINLVVSGSFGGNMKGALETKNIKYKKISGVSIKEALKNA